ncbi:hypothetical protein IAU60_002847 [Kwoniella sp. DSM 27419]
MSDDQVTIFIPSFPVSPPSTPTRTLSTSPEWFTTPVKAPYRPSPLSKAIILPDLEHIDPFDNTLSEMLTSDPETPPLSPGSTVGSVAMTRGRSASSSGSDGDAESEEIITPPAALRRPSLKHTGTPPSYFNLESPNKDERRARKNKYRARFPSAPVTGSITPMWQLEQESKVKQLLEPFDYLLPQTIRRDSEPNYILSEDSFVLTHIPAKTVSLSDFRPRIPRVPRWQRPIMIVVMSVLLFGTLCMISWFQQSLTRAEHAQVIRRSEWMARHSAMAKQESDVLVELEPGYKFAAPNHHSLKVQGKFAKRAVAGQAVAKAPSVPFVMTKEEELAALMHFIVGTTANTLPDNLDTTDRTSLEGFLPFDVRSPMARAEIQDLATTQWEDHPVMVLGNMRDPKMREIRATLRGYNVKPAPFYVDIDQRRDAAVLQPTLERLLGKQDGPYVLLAGQNIGSAVKLSELEKKETLISTFASSGVSIAKKLKKNKHQREEERTENERILGPKRIKIDVVDTEA